MVNYNHSHSKGIIRNFRIKSKFKTTLIVQKTTNTTI